MTTTTTSSTTTTTTATEKLLEVIKKTAGLPLKQNKQSHVAQDGAKAIKKTVSVGPSVRFAAIKLKFVGKTNKL